MVAKKKQMKSKGTANKMTPMKKLAMKRGTPKKKLAKKKATQKRAAVKTKAVGKKTVGALRKQAREKSQSVDIVAFPRKERESRSGGQSGDLQGLSNIEGADSESVDELLEEGNAFEADAVMGVEDAGKLKRRKFARMRCRRMMSPANIWIKGRARGRE